MELGKRIVLLRYFWNLEHAADMAGNLGVRKMLYKGQCHVGTSNFDVSRAIIILKSPAPAATPELVQILPSTIHRAWGTHSISFGVAA
jgi:hypothetical protein